jgi:hypothetical protein
VPEDVACSSIFTDIRNHATCTIEALLNGLLLICLPDEHKDNPPTDLLDQCINAVLPICNTQDNPIQMKAKQKRVDEETLADGMGLRTYLAE